MSEDTNQVAPLFEESKLLINERMQEIERLRPFEEDFYNFRQILLEEASQLDQWADESVEKGWSFRLVEQMRNRANDLRRIALHTSKGAAILVRKR